MHKFLQYKFLRHKYFQYALVTSGITTALSLCMPVAASADTWIERSSVEPVITYPGAPGFTYMRTKTTTTTSDYPSSAPQVVTIEKPVVIEKTIKTYDKTIINRSTTSGAIVHRTLVRKARPKVAHRTYATRNKIAMIKTHSTVTTIEKPVVVEKRIYVDRPYDRVVERPVVIEKKVYVDRPVRPVVIEQPVLIQRQLSQPVIIEEKRHSHHLFKVKTPLAGVSVF